MDSVSFTSISNNRKLYFSKSELTKILNCYSIGVSNGNWKDYALNFKSNEAIFSFFKHTHASPDCVLKKYKEKKIKKTFFHLFIDKKNIRFEDLDNLISSIKRTQIFIVSS